MENCDILGAGPSGAHALPCLAVTPALRLAAVLPLTLLACKQAPSRATDPAEGATVSVTAEPPPPAPAPQPSEAPAAATTASVTAPKEATAPTSTSTARTTPTAQVATPTPSVSARVAEAAPPATASAAAPPAETAKPIASPPVGDGAFRAWLTAPAKQRAGQPGHVDVVLAASGEYHCNEKYPYRFKLGAAPAGVTYPEPIVRTASIGAARSTMQVPFVASHAGDFPISGKFSFSVCTASNCVVDSRDLAITVHVE